MQESKVGSRPGLKTLQGQEVQEAIAGGEGLGGEEWCKAQEVEVAWGTRAWASALQGSSFTHVGPRRHQKTPVEVLSLPLHCYIKETTHLPTFSPDHKFQSKREP